MMFIEAVNGAITEKLADDWNILFGGSARYEISTENKKEKE